jgi:Tfp pilus assembly protein PilV
LLSTLRIMQARSLRTQRGTSLIEAVGTMGFIGVAVVGFSMNSVTLTRANKTAGSVTEATALAQHKLEELRSMPLGAAELAPGAYADGANPMRADGSRPGAFRRTWTVSAKDSPRAGLKTVAVSVAWTDSRAHTARLAAYVRCSTVPCS